MIGKIIKRYFIVFVFTIVLLLGATQQKVQASDYHLELRDKVWYCVDSNDDIAYGHNDVVHNIQGWWKVTDGKVDFSFSGFAANEYGTWRIVRGKVDFSANGLIRSEADGKWGYVINGCVKTNYSGLIQNKYGFWHVKMAM
jgi:hypothetical protein